MGNQNDYLTLEESARMLGRPVSMLKSVISEGKLNAKLSGGRWLISVRDLEIVQQELSPQPEKVAQNSLSDRPEVPQRSSTSQVASGRSSTRTGVDGDQRNARDRRNGAVSEETRKQRRIKELESAIRRMRPALERIIRKRQKMISQGRVPSINKPSKKLLQDWRKLQDELDQLQGKGKWNKPPRKRVPKKTQRRNAPEKTQKTVEKAKDTPAGASVSAEIVVKRKKKVKRKAKPGVQRAMFAQKPERVNTFDPSRKLEIWEKPQGAKRGRYIPPGT